MNYQSKDMLFVYRPSSEWHLRTDLTQGKIYSARCNEGMVYSSDGIYYSLVSDLGKLIEVHERHFIPLETLRQEKLKELGI